MAKPDWGELQQQFLSDHAATGVSPKDWCEEQGLNYSSAKRYIKVMTYGAKSQKEKAGPAKQKPKPSSTVPKRILPPELLRQNVRWQSG